MDNHASDASTMSHQAIPFANASANPTSTNPAQYSITQHTSPVRSLFDNTFIPVAICQHKLALHCALASQKCCACQDERQHTAFYPRYIDGIGEVLDAPRWHNYCSYCKYGWSGVVNRANVRPLDSRIPHNPPLDLPLPSVLPRWRPQTMDPMDVDGQADSVDTFPATWAAFAVQYPNYRTEATPDVLDAAYKWQNLETRLVNIESPTNTGSDIRSLQVELIRARLVVKDAVAQLQMTPAWVGLPAFPNTRTNTSMSAQPSISRRSTMVTEVDDTTSSTDNDSDGIGNRASRTITTEAETSTLASNRRREVRERFDREMEHHPHLLMPQSNHSYYMYPHPVSNSGFRSGGTSIADSTTPTTSDVDSMAATAGDDDRVPSDIPSPTAPQRPVHQYPFSVRARRPGPGTQPSYFFPNPYSPVFPISPTRAQRRRTMAAPIASPTDNVNTWMPDSATAPWFPPTGMQALMRAPPAPMTETPLPQDNVASVLGTREDAQREDYTSPIQTLFSNEWEAYRQAEDRRRFQAREAQFRAERAERERNSLQNERNILQHERNNLQAELRSEQALLQARTQILQDQETHLQTLRAREQQARERLGDVLPHTRTLADHLDDTTDEDSAASPDNNTGPETSHHSIPNPANHNPAAMYPVIATSSTIPTRSNRRRSLQEQARNRQQPFRTTSSNSAFNDFDSGILQVQANVEGMSPFARIGHGGRRRMRERADAELSQEHTEAFRRASEYAGLIGGTLARQRNRANSMPVVKSLDVPERPENLNDDQMTIKADCKVCYGQIADTVLLPCAHLALCQWCADVCAPILPGRQDQVAPRNNCPVCRTKVDKRIKVFRA